MIQNLKTFLFGTKAETLKRLQPLISKSIVPDCFYFHTVEWEQDPKQILQKIYSEFGSNNENSKVAIRSSAHSEDNVETSMAGVYHSFIDIDSKDTPAISDAICGVIKSFKCKNEKDSLQDQVLVQRMIVQNISMSGVIFTQDMKTGAPYYVINYDDQSGLTNTVTSGGLHSNRTLMVFRDEVSRLYSERFKILLLAVEEIEKVSEQDALDIEFAVDNDNKVYIFQVRKITTRPNWNRGLSLRVQDSIYRIHNFVSEHFQSRVGWFGKRSIFAQMPDWNPAEMLGATPRPLALSLYRYLITDYAWRVARRQMGYAEPKGAPLMVSLGGQPFIDVRLSFHSFLPKDLDSNIGEKLVNAWLDRLSKHGDLHDKIEFEISINSLSFDFEELMAIQVQNILTDSEKKSFCQALFNLTNNLLTGSVASIDGELQKINQLEQERIRLLSIYKKPELHVISALLEDCILLGTIPFSILARHAFIAKSFLRALVRKSIISESEMLSFQKSIKSVASELVYDLEKAITGKINLDTFLNKFGHLRPGTYDILSLRYDQRNDLMKELCNREICHVPKEEFSFTTLQKQGIQALCSEFDYDFTPDHLINYIIKATTAREYAKFQFTKNLSEALEIIAAWGENIGLSRNELSYLSIENVLNCDILTEGRTLEQNLREHSQLGKSKHEITQAIRLPPVINKDTDVFIVPLFLSRPNFITKKSTRGPYIFLDRHSQQTDVSNKIVLIESADPGFDWIFACSLTGLITKYGGVNSHMAIRCTEFGLPAAIGCGEQIFDRIIRSQSVEINCSEERIVTI